MAIQHSAIPDADRHEPKGASTAAAGSVYVSDGAASGTWKWQPQVATLDIASLDTVGDYYIPFAYNSTIDKVYSTIDGAILTADKTLTLSIGGVDVTNGVITITQAGSAAGDVDSCTPTANNTVSAGAALKVAATGGTTGGIRAHLTIVYTRTA